VSFIVDASVAIKWIVPESLSDEADRFLAGTHDEILAPDLLLIEAANTLWKKTVRRELRAREADRAFALLLESGLLMRPTSPLLPRAMRLARDLGHPVYDCVYLALAEQEDAALVSADQRLLRLRSKRKMKARLVALQDVS
jgi:predicted nucleic acid-binding protein